MLIDALGGADVEVRSAAIRALCSVPIEDDLAQEWVMPLLFQRCRIEEDAGVRRQLMRGLLSRCTPDALAPLLNDLWISEGEPENRGGGLFR